MDCSVARVDREIDIYTLFKKQSREVTGTSQGKKDKMVNS